MIYKCLEYDSNQPAEQQSWRHIIRTGLPNQQQYNIVPTWNSILSQK